MAIDFEKLRKQTEYELVYTINGEEAISVRPPVGAKTKVMRILRSADNKKDVSTKPMEDFLFDLFVESNPGVTEKERGIVRTFIEENIDNLWKQTLIQFRITTQEEIEKREKEIMDRLIEKNLM